MKWIRAVGRVLLAFGVVLFVESVVRQVMTGRVHATGPASGPWTVGTALILIGAYWSWCEDPNRRDK